MLDTLIALPKVALFNSLIFFSFFLGGEERREYLKYYFTGEVFKLEINLELHEKKIFMIWCQCGEVRKHKIYTTMKKLWGMAKMKPLLKPT